MKLSISNTGFYLTLENTLEEKGEAQIENFICKDWNVYYNLYNPENFEDPDNSPEWYDSSDVYEYYEKPTSPSTILLYGDRNNSTIEQLRYIIKNTAEVEQKILNSIEQHTFGGEGAYAAAIHFQYAKKTIETSEEIQYSESDFLKRSLRIQQLELDQKTESLKLYFRCAWNEEHGLIVSWKQEKVASIQS